MEIWHLSRGALVGCLFNFSLGCSNKIGDDRNLVPISKLMRSVQIVTLTKSCTHRTRSFSFAVTKITVIVDDTLLLQESLQLHSLY